MPTEPIANKFQTFELFKGERWTAIPRFFFEMRGKYSTLPASFWDTLFFIFNETIGRTREGVSGYLAQSQIPGDAHEVGKWIAALDVFGGLLTVEYADYRSQKGSRFILNPAATPDDWEHFFYMLSIAYMEGHFRRKVWDGDAEVRNSVERVRAFFKSWRMVNDYGTPYEGKHAPIWSLMVMRALLHGSEWEKDAADVDVTNDANWVARGYDMVWLQKDSGDRIDEFAGLTVGEEGMLHQLLHWAWTLAGESDRAPMIPHDAAPKMLLGKGGHDAEPTEDSDGYKLDNVLAKFQRVERLEHPDCTTWLESPWLTRQWQRSQMLGGKWHPAV